MDINRSSMLILHPTSLPNGHGIGDFGKTAFEWLDFLDLAGIGIWQVLPLGPTDKTQFSPYSSSSSTLGNFGLIDLELLISLDLINKNNLNEKPKNLDKVNYPEVYTYKDSVLREAHNNLYNSSENTIKEELENFENQNKEIQSELAFQMATSIYGDSWKNWPSNLMQPSTNDINEFTNKNKREYSFQLFVQYLFSTQWNKLRQYASTKDIKILGDIPIYTNFHSCDVWLNRELFELDENNDMPFVAGAAPDIFTASGQIWDNPLYLWEKHKEEDYKFWIQRLKGCLNNYDLLRIDHFGGLFKFWAIPRNELGTEGHWRDGPGHNFLEIIKSEINLDNLLAEDLFAINPLVEMDKAREVFQIPGLKLLNQRIPHDSWDDELPPNKWGYNFAAYTGTHDSPTLKQWIAETSEGQRNNLREYIDSNIQNKQHSEVWDSIAVVWETKCQLAGTMVQDLLELGSEARFNIPGQQIGNWDWRLTSMEELSNLSEKLYALNKATERC